MDLSELFITVYYCLQSTYCLLLHKFNTATQKVVWERPKSDYCGISPIVNDLYTINNKYNFTKIHNGCKTENFPRVSPDKLTQRGVMIYTTSAKAVPTWSSS